MKKIVSTLVLSLALILGSSLPAANAAESRGKLDIVFYNLLGFHLSKPKQEQLVRGALKKVSESLAESTKHAYFYAADDDTLPELKQRLAKWKKESDVDTDKLELLAINGMLGTLDDPHTVFFRKVELKQFTESVENEIVGFGFRLRMEGDQPMIREVIADSPAQAAGLEAGDIISSVDGTLMKGKSFESVFTSLQGPEGKESSFVVYRPHEKRELRFTMKRAVLEIPETSTDRFSDNIGYLRLDTFSSDAGTKFQNSLQTLTNTKQPLKGLIIDLRNNGGGYLSSARDIASLFMENGVLMYTIDRNGIEVATNVYNGRTVTYPVTILVNESTASASEMLSGALQDYGIAKLVGNKTYGKGSAQQVVPFPEGDALKITLHEYFTPKHRVVNHVGLTPDVLVEDDIAQVIAGLKQFGVSHFRLEEQGDQILINGVTFPSLSPLFTRNGDNVSIRSSVLSQVTNGKSEGTNPSSSYVPVGPLLEKGSGFTLTINQDSIVLENP